MSKKIGFIGCGNMAKAIMGGMIKAGVVAAGDITASDVYQAGLAATKQNLGINTTDDNRRLAAGSDVIFLAVKPHILGGVLQEIAPDITGSKLVISIAAGQSLEKIEKGFDKKVKLIRLMPNTPALVNCGMTAVCPNELISKEELEYALTLLRSFGMAEVVPEKLMDAVVAVSGSSPAYVFMFIEAMADAAVREGMPRAQAYTFAAQSVMGSAKMVLESGKHPGELKDMVCSPAGTTIDAVAALEACGFRNAVIQGMTACADKNRGLA